jgi:hypothetical protein
MPAVNFSTGGLIKTSIIANRNKIDILNYDPFRISAGSLRFREQEDK